MKKRLLFIAILLVSIELMAQNKNWSVGVSYPNLISIDNRGWALTDLDNATGIIDVDLKYRFINRGKFPAGVSLNYNYTHGDIDIGYNEFPTGLSFLHANFFQDFNFAVLEPASFFVSTGYSLLERRTKGFYEDYIEYLNGINLKGGIEYNFSKYLFFQINYQYIVVLPEDYEYPDKPRVSSIKFLKFGIGYRF